MQVFLRFRPASAEAGMAIGPILLIVAIIGILAAAMAAGSGSFNNNSATEAARTKASALIQIGTILKTGFSRMTGAGADFDSINIDPADTVSEDDLFAPAGGSVNVPSVALANDPGTDIWYYPLAALPQLGTGATDRLAMLKVPKPMCNQINIKANALTTDAEDGALSNDIGNVTAATLTGAANWPAALLGKEVGCLRNTNSATPGFFYFQVLGIR